MNRFVTTGAERWSRRRWRRPPASAMAPSLALVRQVLGTPGSPTNLAHLFYALVQGCGLMHPAPPEDAFWDDAAQAALRLLAHP